MIDRLKRGRLWVAFALLALSCGKANSPQSSSSSHWLNCEAAADCSALGGGAYCGEQGYCVGPSGEPLAVDGSGAAASGAETLLPSGGSSLESLALSQPRQMVVDEAGVIWLIGCEGLFAIQGSEIRRYTWVDSALPEAYVDLLVDAQNRLWLFSSGRSLQVIERGEFRTVAEGAVAQFSVARDGSVWIAGSDAFEEFSRTWVRQVSPALGEKLTVPEAEVYGLAADSDGSLWVATRGGIYRWSGAAWAGPLGLDSVFVNYDPRQDVVSTGNERLHWNGTGVSREPLLPDPSPDYGQQLGFDDRGRLITVDLSAVRWIENGQVAEIVALSGLDRTPTSALGPNGSVYLATDSRISRLAAGRLTQLLNVTPFEPDVQFSWRVQPFGRTLADPSIDMSYPQLAEPARDAVGVKVHVRGVAFGGFETAGVVVDGSTLPSTWADAADELWSFMSERGRSPFIELPERLGPSQPRVEEAPPWDVYGYLETGTCFGVGTTRQFWMVEGYPVDMPAAEREALAAGLRARYPAR
jgi:hypothetical protein